MATTMYDAAERSRGVILGALASAFGVVMSTAKRVSTPHKASLKRLWDMPLSVVGVACIDYSAFLVDHPLGWLVTGISAIAVEYHISDGDE